MNAPNAHRCSHGSRPPWSTVILATVPMTLASPVLRSLAGQQSGGITCGPLERPSQRRTLDWTTGITRSCRTLPEESF
jgi:hypothetical protein